MNTYSFFEPNDGTRSDAANANFLSHNAPFSAKHPVWEAFLPVSLEGERTLLEELGVNFTVIFQKTLIILNPFRSFDQGIMQNDDLAGPLTFYVLFGFLLFLSGKAQFGHVYGLALIGCVSLYFLLNLMSQHVIDMFRVASILGYSFIPLILLSSIIFFFRLRYVAN